jgi:hypothetical protein
MPEKPKHLEVACMCVYRGAMPADGRRIRERRIATIWATRLEMLLALCSLGSVIRGATMPKRTPDGIGADETRVPRMTVQAGQYEVARVQVSALAKETAAGSRTSKAAIV